MNEFFTSTHCQCRLHCVTCRSTTSGSRWRASTAKAFGLQGSGFDCPHGIAWDVAFVEPKTSIYSLKGKLLSYQDVVKLITDAPDTPEWSILKDELRLTEAFITLNESRQTPCWKKRQQSRLVRSYETMRQKESCLADSKQV